MFLVENNNFKLMLSISGFILTTIVMILVFYYLISFTFKYKQVSLFKKQDVKFFENKNYKLLFIFSWLITLFLYFSNILTFTIYLLLDKNANSSEIVVYVINEIISLILIIWIIVYIVVISKSLSSLIVIVKNEKIVFIEDIFEIKNIKEIFNDSKRKYIFINFFIKDKNNNSQKSEQLKIRYCYQLKDFLDEIQGIKKTWN
ncbi:hypothetical protein ESOMN_v1c03910 [Williamsoniiplasma somnilux]|uniref:Transmembrane protein n=1 Tax=Williamsoniiplasma somnilux TaxID=215578 RepID=A0A2K8P1J3_9MOLU|nr:hypothetical protein [Williamsoniiplasma somnilux]ATZ18773.1 hypothetical protein ESOMN_v1c03910 [Williamsoniiplasma somnilux]